MSGRKGLIEFVAVVFLVLIFSAFRTETARADGGSPSPTATPSVTQQVDNGDSGASPVATTDPSASSGQPTSDPAITQNTATVAPADSATPIPTDPAVSQTAETTTPTDPATAVPTDAAVTVASEVSTPSPTETASGPVVAASDATTQPISQIPPGSQFVLQSGNQPAIPLGSAEAASILATGDPIWCPTGVTPIANTGGCTATLGLFNGVGGLLAAMKDKATSGTIWIESSYTGAGEGGAVLLDNSYVGTSVNFALTLQGGWTGTGKTIDSTTPSTFTNTSLTINWNADVTLNDILVTGVGTGTALTVTTPKNITVNRVKVKTNTGASGAVLDNTAGTGNVSVTTSQFNDNTGGTGLYVVSKGTISLSAVTADGNGGYGVDLRNQTASSAKNVTLVTGPYEFKDNGNAGLSILSRGAISLKDINALKNAVDGAYLNNTFATTAQGITLTGSNVFSQNVNPHYYGVEAYSNGPISASNLVANANGGAGALLLNSGAASAQPITLTGSSNQFNGNSGGTGLQAYSKGAINMSAVTADNNRDYGAILDNSTAPSAMNVTMTSGPYEFNGNGSNNGHDGLYITSKGAIALKDIDALKNTGGGAYLDNTFATTPQGITFTGSNVFSENSFRGIYAQSDGAISANNLVANANGDWGAQLLNSGAASAQPVTLTGGSNQFTANQFGLDIVTKGNIALPGIIASYNWGDPGVSSASGANLDNCVWNGVKCTGSGNVNLTGSSTFDNNFRGGLTATSGGTIIIANLSTDANSFGALLTNNGATAPKSVTLTGTLNTFTNNTDGNGLEIQTKGAIIVANLTANGNSGDGVLLNNQVSLASPQNVTLTGSNTFNGNGDSGLIITTYGAIAVNNLTANNNTAINMPFAAELDNCGYNIINHTCASTLVKSVTLTGTNTFQDNHRDGLGVFSAGPVLANALTASDNESTGAGLQNYYASTPQPVSVTGINTFTGNVLSYGLSILTKGTISVNNLIAHGNYTGISLDNTRASTPQPVTLSGNNISDGNTFYGLFVQSKGAISVGNTEASGNGFIGAWLDNFGAATPQPITLSGTLNTFNNNTGGNGLEIQTTGAVTIANLTANGNKGDGALLNNQVSLASPQNVTLTGSNTFNGNGDSGLAITTYGTIAGNNLTANNNGSNHGAYGWGAYLDNCQYSGGTCHTALVKSITLTGLNTFDANYLDGLFAAAKGSIQANSLTANGNARNGALLMNFWTGASGGVTLTGINTFNSNGSGLGPEGLFIGSNGSISVNNLTANSNASDGVDLFTTQQVTLTGTNTFLSNKLIGLAVRTGGNITLNNVTAEGNSRDGTRLDNCAWSGSTCTGSGTIILTGTNTFSNNSTDGLYFTTQNNVTIAGVTADKNSSGSGVDGITHGGAITILGGSMTGNLFFGWQLSALTTVTLKGVFAYGNNGGGPDTNLYGGTLIIVRTYP